MIMGYKNDVKTTFISGKLSYNAYMTQPKGFEHAKYTNKVCKPEMSIYGLKQTSR